MATGGKLIHERQSETVDFDALEYRTAFPEWLTEL